MSALDEGSGRGVTVAVLDTGLDPSHEDFSALDCGGCLRPDEGAGWVEEAGDEVGHGTAIAGVIHRIAPEATVISIAVLAGDRRERHSRIREGALMAIERGADVLNCSFGVSGAMHTFPMYREWTGVAGRRGVAVVAASSNLNAEHPEWPSHLEGVIAVTAGEGRLRWRSDSPVAFAAPGTAVRVPVPGGGHAVMTGSSFATAHVSGMVARLLSRFPDLSPKLAYEALRGAAHQMQFTG